MGTAVGTAIGAAVAGNTVPAATICPPTSTFTELNGTAAAVRLPLQVVSLEATAGGHVIVCWPLTVWICTMAD